MPYHLSRKSELTFILDFSDGTRPLHLAAGHDSETLVRLLLEHGAEIDATDRKGDTPLHYAVLKRSTNAGEALLRRSPNLAWKNAFGKTSLHVASEGGYNDIMEKLLNWDTNVNAYDDDGNTSLHLALCHEHVSAAELLVKKGANVALKDQKGNTGLHFAIKMRYNETGSETLLRSMLDQGGPINIRNDLGSTPLYDAILRRLVRRVRLLLEKGAEANFREGNNNETPLHLASRLGSHEMVKMLVYYGAQVNALDKHGHTSLDEAILNCNAFIGREKSIQILVDSGAFVIPSTQQRSRSPLRIDQSGILAGSQLVHGVSKALETAEGEMTQSCHLNWMNLDELQITFDTEIQQLRQAARAIYHRIKVMWRQMRTVGKVSSKKAKNSADKVANELMPRLKHHMSDEVDCLRRKQMYIQYLAFHTMGVEAQLQWVIGRRQRARSRCREFRGRA